MRLAALALLCVSCALRPGPVPNVPVAEITTAAGNRASATHIGEGLWLTNRHVVCESGPGTLAGVSVQFVVVQSGGDPTPLEDWTLFKTVPAVPAEALEVDFSKRPEPGTAVWVLGFGSPGEEFPEGLPANNVVAEVTRPIHNTDTGVTLRMPDPRAYHGLSGGAVILNNKVVAIVAGHLTRGNDTRHLAIQPPCSTTKTECRSASSTGQSSRMSPPATCSGCSTR